MTHKKSAIFLFMIILLSCNTSKILGMNYIYRSMTNLISMADPVRLLENQWTYGSYNKAWELMMSFFTHQAKSFTAQPLSQTIEDLDVDTEQLETLAQELNIDMSRIGVNFTQDHSISDTQLAGHTVTQPQLLIPRTPFLRTFDRKERTILLGLNLVSIKDKALIKIASLACLIPYTINNLASMLCSPKESLNGINNSPSPQELTLATIPIAVLLLRYAEYYIQKRSDIKTARELGAQESIETLEHMQDIAVHTYAESSLIKKLYDALYDVLQTAPTLQQRITYLRPLAEQQALEQIPESVHQTH